MISVLKCHCKHLIGIQRRLQRDVTQGGIERIFARRQQSRTFHFLIVSTTAKAKCRQWFQCLCHIIYIARIGILLFEGRQLIVRHICRIVHGKIWLPIVVRQPAVLAQVLQCHQVARLLILAALVGHPHFDAGNRHTRRNIRQFRSKLIIVVAKEVRQEVVTILVVLVHIHGELGSLRPTLGIHRLALGILLRNQTGHGQSAELQLAFDAKQRRATLYQRRPGGHRHITGLDTLHYIILLALVVESQVLGVEVESRVGIVGHIEVHTVAHRSINGGLYALIKIEIGLAARINRQRRVVGEVALHAHIDLYRPLGFKLHSTRPEYFFQRAQRKVHIQNVERGFLLVGHQSQIALAIVLLKRLAQLPVIVLLLGEHKRCGDVVIPNLGAYHIATGGRVVLGLSSHILRIAKVHRRCRTHQVLITHRHGMPHVRVLCRV